MPKLPKGMFLRGKSFYFRRQQDGRDCWISLGQDYQQACRELRRTRVGGKRLTVRTTVSQAAELWLDSYVRTARNEKNSASPGAGFKPTSASTWASSSWRWSHPTTCGSTGSGLSGRKSLCKLWSTS
jgi:hypothetical protein